MQIFIQGLVTYVGLTYKYVSMCMCMCMHTLEIGTYRLRHNWGHFTNKFTYMDPHLFALCCVCMYVRMYVRVNMHINLQTNSHTRDPQPSALYCACMYVHMYVCMYKVCT